MIQTAKLKNPLKPSEFNDFSMQWKPPLRRLLDKDGFVLNVTIRVRVYRGNTEHEVNTKFNVEDPTVADILTAICDKELLSPSERPLFSLWVVGKDLELQLRPSMGIFKVMDIWNVYVLKYTHFPEAVNAAHPINNHWFILRREASLTSAQEESMVKSASLQILFGEAYHCYLKKRYVCSIMDAAMLAGVQLQADYGDSATSSLNPQSLE